MKYLRISFSIFFLWLSIPQIPAKSGRAICFGSSGWGHSIDYFIGTQAFSGDKAAQNVIFQWLTKQLNKRPYPQVYNDLGVCYRKGWGCAPDEIKAVEYFEKAMRQGSRGDRFTYFHLSAFYYKGKGRIKKDPDKAKVFFNMGIKENDDSFIHLFQALRALNKSKEDFFSWWIQLEPKVSSPLTPEKIQECFETFTFFINQSEEIENQFFQLMMDKHWHDLSTMHYITIASFLKKSFALINAVEAHKKQSLPVNSQ